MSLFYAKAQDLSALNSIPSSKPTTISSCVTGCAANTIANPTTSTKYATKCERRLLISEVWVGVPLTVEEARTAPTLDCARSLTSPGSGYTGSNEYTSFTYFVGYIDLMDSTVMSMSFDLGSDELQFLSNTQYNGSTLFIDGQEIGCFRSSYDVISGYAMGVNITKTARIIPLATPVTQLGRQLFLTTTMGQTSLAPAVRTQLSLACEATAPPASTVKKTASSQIVLPSTLFPVAAPSFALDRSAEMDIITTIGIGSSAVFVMIGLSIWRRFSVRGRQSKTSAPTSVNVSVSRACGAYSKAHQATVMKIQSTLTKRSWRAPHMMVGGLLCGLVFSAGHHFFYNSLDHRSVQDVSIPQSWVVRLGNLSAFAVKLSFSLSVGVAFIQIQWLKFRQQSLKVKEIDSLSNILGNILNFSGSSIWFRFPTLTLVALLYWSLAIMPVITPGAINVVTDSYINMTHLQVPQLNTESTHWLSLVNGGTSSSTLVRLVSACGFLGEILPLNFDYSNATYHLDFIGPAIKCDDAESSLTQDVIQLLSPSVRPDYYVYYSWAGVLPEEEKGTEMCSDSIDEVSTDRARLYIMTGDASGKYNLTECALYNATYSVDFTFNNSQQAIDIQNLTYHNGVSSNPKLFDTDEQYQIQSIAYYGLMYAFGSLLVGNIQEHPSGIIRECTMVDSLNLEVGIGHETVTAEPAQLQRSFEDIFRKMTISLMSSPEFTKNTADAQFVPVNITLSLTTYIYNSFDLLLTYGIGLLVTMGCSLIGFYAFLINDGSYQNTFSTFIRATSSSQLVNERGDTGVDPLPKSLSRAAVRMAGDSSSVNLPQSLGQQSLINRKSVPISRQETESTMSLENDERQTA